MCNQLDLETLGSLLIVPKILHEHWLAPTTTVELVGSRKRLLDRTHLGILWPNFGPFYKGINYQYLISHF